jgi:hypothetical protein
MKLARIVLLIAVLATAASCVAPEPYNGRGVEEGGNVGCPRGYPEDYFPNRPDYRCSR